MGNPLESDPVYSQVCAQLLLHKLWGEVVSGLQLNDTVPQHYEGECYGHLLVQGIETGIEHELLTPELRSFDLDQLASAFQPERDRQFTYLGLQTLYDRY